MTYTDVTLCCVPLTVDGRYTADFPNASARDSWVDGFNVLSGRVSNCYYIRKDNIIKVPYNADCLDDLGVNYVRYTNDNGRTMCAFVTNIEYTAENTTVLHIKTDSFMTYQFDIVKNEALIEREHVSNDTRGLHILDEPIGITGFENKYILQKYYSTNTSEAFNASWYVAIIIGRLNISDDDVNADAKKSINTNASKYSGGVPIGGNLFAVSYNDFPTCIEALQVLNAEIVCAFPILKECATQVGTIAVTFTNEDVVKEFTILGVSQIGYTLSMDYDEEPWSTPARNNKLYTFPYNSLVGTNECGSEQTYKIERLGSTSCYFTYMIAPTPSFVLIPNNYEGLNNDVRTAVTNANIPSVPWSTNAYTQYLSRNLNSLQVATIRRELRGVQGSMAFVGAVTGKTANGANTSSLIEPAMAIEEYNAQMNDLKSLGNSVYNLPSSNLLGYNSKLGVGVYQRFAIESEKERIDEFFDRYGYNVQRVGTIQWNSRPHYNYVKTSNANIGGSIPQKNKAEINALLNGGLTVWHVTNGGSYGVFDHDNK